MNYVLFLYYLPQGWQIFLQLLEKHFLCMLAHVLLTSMVRWSRNYFYTHSAHRKKYQCPTVWKCLSQDLNLGSGTPDPWPSFLGLPSLLSSDSGWSLYLRLLGTDSCYPTCSVFHQTFLPFQVEGEGERGSGQPGWPWQTFPQPWLPFKTSRLLPAKAGGGLCCCQDGKVTVIFQGRVINNIHK